MARRNKSRFTGIRNFVILVIVMLVGAAALNASGNLHNPLEMTSMIVNMATGGEQPGGGRGTRGGHEGGERGGHEGSQGDGSYALADYFDFEWGDIGNVLYNFWVMLAATVAVIFIARPVGWLVKRLKRLSVPREPNPA